ncbi:MAG: SirB2 family protein, partial [Bacteroidia bacterium]
MYKAVLHTHWLVVTLFFLIYVIKTVLLLSNRNDLLQRFTKATKVAEMIISALFLITGIYLMTQLPEIKTLMWVKLALVFASIPIAVVGFKKGNKILAALAL